MIKYESDAMELIETMVENNQYNATKPFGQGAMLRGHMIDTKSAETTMLLDRIHKMEDVQNLLLDRLNIRNDYE